MTSFLSIDQSTKKNGYAVWLLKDGNWVLEHTGFIDFTNEGELGDRLLAYYYWLMELRDLWKPDIVITENPATLLRISPGYGKQLSESLGIMKLVFTKQNISVLEISPTSAKKAFTGYGRAKKDKVLAEAQRRYPEHNINEYDVSDAVAIGYHYLLEITDK